MTNATDSDSKFSLNAKRPPCRGQELMSAARGMASVRDAINSASTNNTEASRNGAPDNFTGACAPMNQANVSVNRNGPTSWDRLCTLDVAPCNWHCWSGATDCVISACKAAPETPHNAITGIPSHN